MASADKVMSHHHPPLLLADVTALTAVIASFHFDIPTIVTCLAGIYYVIMIMKSLRGKRD